MTKKLVVVTWLGEHSSSSLSLSGLLDYTGIRSNVVGSHSALMVLDGDDLIAYLSFYGGRADVINPNGTVDSCCSNDNRHASHVHGIRDDGFIEDDEGWIRSGYDLFISPDEAHLTYLEVSTPGFDKAIAEIKNIRVKNSTWGYQSNCADLVMRVLQASIPYSAYSRSLYPTIGLSFVRSYLSPGIFGKTNIVWKAFFERTIALAPVIGFLQKSETPNISFESMVLLSNLYCIAWEAAYSYFVNAKYQLPISVRIKDILMNAAIPLSATGLLLISVVSNNTKWFFSAYKFFTFNGFSEEIKGRVSSFIIDRLMHLRWDLKLPTVGLLGIRNMLVQIVSLLLISMSKGTLKQKGIVASISSLVIAISEYYFSQYKVTMDQDEPWYHDSGIYTQLAYLLFPICMIALSKAYYDQGVTPAYLKDIASKLEVSQDKTSWTYFGFFSGIVSKYIPPKETIIKTTCYTAVVGAGLFALKSVSGSFASTSLPEIPTLQK